MGRRRTLLLGLLGLALAAGPAWEGPAQRARAAGPLITDGDFQRNSSGNRLRRRETGQGWYESRGDGKAGRGLLKLSTKSIGGNATRKAMIKGDPARNTYLSQRLETPQEGRFQLQWDIYVREILPPFNRSAFQMIGNASVKGRGPNATGAERFVFLGFENGAEKGTMNLFAFQGGETEQWDTRTPVASGLKLRHWYTVAVDVDVPGKVYRVAVPGVLDTPAEVRAFHTKGKGAPDVLTHISFASWNDGPGTFYIDNVGQP